MRTEAWPTVASAVMVIPARVGFGCAVRQLADTHAMQKHKVNILSIGLPGTECGDRTATLIMKESRRRFQCTAESTQDSHSPGRP